MIRGHHLFVLAALLGAACTDKDKVDTSNPEETGDPTDDSAAPEVTLDALTLSAESASLTKYETTSLTVTASFSDGSTADVTGEATWTSSDEAVATVTGGEIIAAGAGVADVTAEVEGLTATASVTVDVMAITGDVTLHGWPVGDISISLTGPDEAETLSDPVDGSFAFGDLGVGTYTVTAWASNGRRFAEDSFEVALSSDSNTEPLNFDFIGFGYPSEDDLYAGDDSPESASSIGVDGAFQARSIWPFGTKDWIAVDLTAGVEVEIFTTALCETCDSYLYLYDTDGETELTSGDDHVDYDSQVTWTPEVDGTYYIMVRPYSESSGVVNYFLNALTYVDADEDDMGAFHDCDDGDAAINPWEYEVGGDSVDENCDGHLGPAGSDEDPDEASNGEASGAIPLPLTGSSFEENQHMGAYREMYSRTLHDADDVDWFSVVVPPYGYVYLNNDYYIPGSSSLLYTVYEPDGVTEHHSGAYLSTSLYNETATEETWTIKVSSYEGAAEVWYNFFALDYGVDADADGYYSQDWSSSRDCDDSDASSTDECYP